jgi:protein TonB
MSSRISFRIALGLSFAAHAGGAVVASYCLFGTDGDETARFGLERRNATISVSIVGFMAHPAVSQAEKAEVGPPQLEPRRVESAPRDPVPTLAAAVPAAWTPGPEPEPTPPPPPVLDRPEVPAATPPREADERLAPSLAELPPVDLQPPALAASEIAGSEGSEAWSEASSTGIRNRAPSYPTIARRNGWAGTVILEIEVAADGAATAVHVKRSSGYPVLDEAALAAARAWRFQPARRHGQPVTSRVSIPVVFDLTRA